MDLYKAIEGRRTIRKFKGAATEEQIKRIVVAGTKAPSGSNQQKWEFIVVDDKSLIEQISELKFIMNRGKPRGEPVPDEVEKGCQVQKDSFFNASLVLVYHGEGPAHVASAWLCIENMLLAAVAEGLGTKISYFAGDALNKVNQLMKVPKDLYLACALSIGIPDEKSAPRSLRKEGTWLHKNKY